MGTTTGKTECITCGKEKVAYKCEGCSQTFCFNHLADHRQILIKQLDDLENERNLFRQTLSEQSNHQQTYSWIQQINQWEKDSMDKIHQTAEEARQLVLKSVGDNRNDIEMKLRKFTEELKQIRQEDDFNEIHLNRFKRKLKELEEQLNKPKHISVKQENSSAFINKISVLITSVFGKFFANISLSIKTFLRF
jgi:chromosome segregation ATPase